MIVGFGVTCVMRHGPSAFISLTYCAALALEPAWLMSCHRLSAIFTSRSQAWSRSGVGAATHASLAANTTSRVCEEDKQFWGTRHAVLREHSCLVPD
jgi:hypothetical protein